MRDSLVANVRPLPGELLVERKKRPDLFGRIIIPESSRRGSYDLTATVTMLSFEARARMPDLAVGDTLILTPAAGRPVHGSLSTIRPEEILCILDEGDMEPAPGSWELGPVPTPEWLEKALYAKETSARLVKETG